MGGETFFNKNNLNVSLLLLCIVYFTIGKKFLDLLLRMLSLKL